MGLVSALLMAGALAPEASAQAGLRLMGVGDRSMGTFNDGQLSRVLSPVVIANDVHAVSQGWSTTYILKTDGTLWAAGENYLGQLGDGTTTKHNQFVPIASSVASISTGQSHSCFVKTDGSLWVTGNNDVGQLGTGDTVIRTAPVSIAANVVHAVAGGRFTLFTQTDGSLWATGQYAPGHSSTTPVKLVDSGVTAIAAGSSHSLYLTTANELYGFGSNSQGELGLGFASSINSPALIATNVSSIAALYLDSYYVKLDGSLWGMGINGHGQLGTGDRLTRRTPVQIATDVASVAAGMYHAVLLKTDGSVWTVGHNFAAQLADGTVTDRLTPVPIAGAGSASAISAGAAQTAYLDSGGTLRAAGSRYSGNFGDGYVHAIALPRTVDGDVYDFSCWQEHVVWVRTDATAWAAGNNFSGQLGDGTTLPRSPAIQLATNVLFAVAGGEHTFVLKRDNTLWAVGGNRFGQLGTGDTDPRPTLVLVATDVATISTSNSHTLFTKTDYTLWACGNNGSGQLGDGTTTQRFTPVQIATDVIGASAGSGFSAFIKSNGELWTMGSNYVGQLGDGTTTQRTTPVHIATDVSRVSAGFTHLLFAKYDGTIWAVGDNSQGQLGDGTTTSRSTPWKLSDAYSGLDDQLEAGFYASYFVTGNSTATTTLWACGTNDHGQLGDGTFTKRLTPVIVARAPSILKVCAGIGQMFFLQDHELAPTVHWAGPAQDVDYHATAQISAEVSGSAPMTYQWYRGNAGDTSQPVAGATTAKFTTPPITGDTKFWLRATNPNGSADSATVALTLDATFESWLATFALPPGETGPEDDPDGDGVPNLVEFLCKTDPSASSTAIHDVQFATAADGRPQIKFRYRRFIDAQIYPLHQWSTDLVNWGSGGMTTTLSPDATDVDGDGTTYVWRITMTFPAGTTKAFVRLRAFR